MPLATVGPRLWAEVRYSPSWLAYGFQKRIGGECFDAEICQLRNAFITRRSQSSLKRWKRRCMYCIVNSERSETSTAKLEWGPIATITWTSCWRTTGEDEWKAGSLVVVVACVGIGESEKLGMLFAQIFPKRQLLKILLSRTELGVSSAHIVPLPAGHPFLGHSPTFHSWINVCNFQAVLVHMVADLSRRCVQAGKVVNSLHPFCDPQFADCWSSDLHNLRKDCSITLNSFLTPNVWSSLEEEGDELAESVVALFSEECDDK